MNAIIPVDIAELISDKCPTLDISNRTAVIQRLTQLHQERKQHRKEAGNILLALRSSTPHGEWEPLLKELCKAVGMSRSTAHNYMNAAEKGAAPKLKDGKTANGYPMDVIRHIFQTSIRRGDEDRAMQCMKELDNSGSTEWMWSRLPVIAAEDVGLAVLGLQYEIEDLRLQWKRKRNDSMFLSHRLFITAAVLLMVRVMKSRLVDHALITYYENQQPIEITEADIQSAAEAAKEPIIIVDDDLDPHSKSGRKLGRRRNTAAGLNHFFDIGAKLNNESPAIEDGYKELARATLIAKNRRSGGAVPADAKQPENPESQKRWAELVKIGDVLMCWQGVTRPRLLTVAKITGKTIVASPSGNLSQGGTHFPICTMTCGRTFAVGIATDADISEVRSFEAEHGSYEEKQDLNYRRYQARHSPVRVAGGAL